MAALDAEPPEVDCGPLVLPQPAATIEQRRIAAHRLRQRVSTTSATVHTAPRSTCQEATFPPYHELRGSVVAEHCAAAEALGSPPKSRQEALFLLEPIPAELMIARPASTLVTRCGRGA